MMLADGWIVERFSSLDSTNRWLLDRAREGAPAGLVAVADHQASGHGRRDRVWQAPAGSSLLVSVLLRPDVALEQLHTVTIAVALALADALMTTGDVRAELKWPNDLVVGDRKLAGLLAEAEVSGDAVRAVVVGAGCNLTQSTFPDELAATATSCVLETGRAPARDDLLTELLARLAERLDESPAARLDEYRARLSTLGRDVRVDLDGGVVTGRASDVDEQGRLVVTPPHGTPSVVGVGDVVHLRPA